MNANLLAQIDRVKQSRTDAGLAIMLCYPAGFVYSHGPAQETYMEAPFYARNEVDLEETKANIVRRGGSWKAL